MGEDIEKFLGTGWYDIETKGLKKWAWSKREAILNFPKTKKGYFITLSVGSDFKEDFLKVCFYDINNNLIGIYFIVKSKKIYVPSSLKKVKIVPEKLQSPSRDKRLLGVCLTEIKEVKEYKEKQDSPPISLALGLNTTCNIKPSCVMCVERALGKLPEKEISQKILDKIKPYIKNLSSISLHGVGEPLLSKYLPIILDMIPENCCSSFNSNGILLTKDMSKLLIAKKLNIINFSIDASTPQTYKKIRRKDSFNKVKENIKQLFLLKKQLKSDFPIIKINMTLMNENLRELPGFVDLAKEIGAQYVCVRLLRYIKNNYIVKTRDFVFNYHEQMIDVNSPHFKNIIQLSKKKAEEYGIIFNSTEKDIIKAMGCKEIPKDKKISEDQRSFEPLCKKPWKNILITASGNCTICCHMVSKNNKSHILGNLEYEDFEKIWNCDNIKEIRRKFLEKKIPDQCTICPIHGSPHENKNNSAFFYLPKIFKKFKFFN